MEPDAVDDDLTVIDRVLAGQVEAFRCLVRRYERLVFQLVGNLVRDSHQVEDIAQEVFLAAYRNLGRFDAGKSAFRTWLLTIARNKSWNALQKQRPLVPGELPLSTDARTPEGECMYRELMRALDRALDELPPDLKTVFVLTEFVGVSAGEIAKIEGVKVGTVRSRLSRGKQHLRLHLKAYAEDTR